jgi:cytoskeletal protein RodZ
MTTTNPGRRQTRRNTGRSQAPVGRDGRSAVGERLRDAREIKGIDLFRAERDTKIRSKYLAALEDGDFTDLPGDVYTRGFIRNYATYLGLDADEIEEEWRSEAGAPDITRPAIVGPQPLTIRRGIVFQRSHGVLAVVLILILVVASYFGFQLTRYLSYPTLAVDSSSHTPITVPVGSTSYVLKGAATPGTTVLISWNGQDPNIVITDDSGHWTYQAALQAGSNEFDITAKNLDTNHASPTLRMIVLVPVATPTPTQPEIGFSTPKDGDSIASGSVTVTGISTEVASVTLTPTYVGPPLAAGASAPPVVPSPSPSPSSSPSLAPSPPAGSSASILPSPSPTPGPAPLTAATAADGTFTFSIQLNPGRWKLSIVGTSPKGSATTALSRTSTVPFSSVSVLIQIKGGSASVAFYHDGITDSTGYNQAAGWSATVVGKKYVCVSTSRPQLVFITVNGLYYGAVSTFGGRSAYIDLKGPKNAPCV